MCVLKSGLQKHNYKHLLFKIDIGKANVCLNYFVASIEICLPCGLKKQMEQASLLMCTNNLQNIYKNPTILLAWPT